MEEKVEDLEFRLDDEEVIENRFEVKDGDKTIIYIGTVSDMVIPQEEESDFRYLNLILGDVSLARYDKTDAIEKKILEYPEFNETEVIEKNSKTVDYMVWKVEGRFTNIVDYENLSNEAMELNLTLSHTLVDKVFGPINEKLNLYYNKMRNMRHPHLKDQEDN